MTITEYPIRPFDGMKYTDLYGREWEYSIEQKTWIYRGLSNRIPLADSSTIGLLSTEFKILIDSLPDKAGGFGIITKFDQTNTGATGLGDILSGLIKLKSESFEIICRDSKGNQLVEECKLPNYSPELNNAPSIDINFSENLLETFCIEIPGGPGPKGNKGKKGPKGADGTGDGPQGLPGKDGADATGVSTISKITIEESDDFYNTAVINLDLDAENSRLHVVKGRVSVANNDTPADRFILQPIYRNLEWTDDGFGYNIIKSPSDTTQSTVDCVLLSYPSDFNPGISDPDSVQAARFNLSRYIDKIIAKYNEAIEKNTEEYDEEIKNFIIAKDEEARKMMDVLVKELAQLEFNDGFEYCMSLQDNGTCGQQVANQLKILNEVTLKAIGESLVRAIAELQNATWKVFNSPATAEPPPVTDEEINDKLPVFRYGQNTYNVSACRFTQEVLLATGYASESASDFCEGAKDTNIGTLVVSPEPSYVRNGELLAAGAYVFSYFSGFMFDNANKGCGYIVGQNSTESGLVLYLETEDSITEFPWPNTSVEHNSHDYEAVQNAYHNSPLGEQSRAIIIPVGVKAKIYAKLVTQDNESFGEVTLKITFCEKC